MVPHPLVDERSRLKARTRARKRTIESIRADIRKDAARVAEIEAMCQRMGIRFDLVTTPHVREGVEETHGRTSD
jgi:hypothetical protein